MALRTNRLLILAALAFGAAPAAAQNYNELSRSDFISLSAGDSSRSNMAIQHEDPWPPFINDTEFVTHGGTAADLIYKFNNRRKEAMPPPPTIIAVPLTPAVPPPVQP